MQPDIGILRELDGITQRRIDDGKLAGAAYAAEVIYLSARCDCRQAVTVARQRAHFAESSVTPFQKAVYRSSVCIEMRGSIDMRHAHGLLHAQHLLCHVYISAAIVYSG